MARNASNHPGARECDDKVRQLQRKLYVAAKRCESRRFHALYDRVHRSDVLWKAWTNVKRNKGAAGVDGVTLEAVEAYGVDRQLETSTAARERKTPRTSRLAGAGRRALSSSWTLLTTPHFNKGASSESSSADASSAVAGAESALRRGLSRVSPTSSSGSSPGVLLKNANLVLRSGDVLAAQSSPANSASRPRARQELRGAGEARRMQ